MAALTNESRYISQNPDGPASLPARWPHTAIPF